MTMSSQHLTVAFVGDLHGSHKRPALDQFVAEVKPDLMLCTGDIQDYRPYPVPLVFVRGNHESWPVLAEMASGTREVHNLFYLVDGKTIDVSGLRVAGIGGNWSPDDRDRPRHIRHAYLDTFRRTHPDIVLSHETPIRYTNRPELCLEPLRDALLAMRPRFWFSGHHHYYEEEQIGRTLAVSLGKWPDEWAVAEIDRGKVLDFRRHTPASPQYLADKARWRRDEANQKDLYLPLDRRNGGGAVYGL